MSKFNAYDALLVLRNTNACHSNVCFDINGKPFAVADTMEHLPVGVKAIAFNSNTHSKKFDVNDDYCVIKIRPENNGMPEIIWYPIEDLKTLSLEYFRPDLKDQLKESQIVVVQDKFPDLIAPFKEALAKEMNRWGQLHQNAILESGRTSCAEPNVGNSPKAEPYPSTIPKIVDHSLRHVLHRAETYDEEGGERSMSKTVQAFNAITGHSLSESDGWLFMQTLKKVRLYTNRENTHLDSMEDGIAYSALEAECIVNKGLKDF